MRTNQQNSFYQGQGDTGHHYYHRHSNGMTSGRQTNGASGAALLWVLKKLWLVAGQLYVLAKYQFYKRTAVAPSSVRLPWLKLGVVAALAFMAFKEDLSISLGMGGQQASFGGTAETVALGGGKKEKKAPKEAGLFSGLFSSEKSDPFAITPEDSEKDRRAKTYINRFKDTAIKEMDDFGIPASIKMAQGILETNSGASGLATKNNNHFGIKCFSRSCKKGHCANFSDDSHKDFFRKYKSAWESWRAHSKMIVSGKYKPLLKHGNDYEKWAHGLKKLGYATADHYDQTLIGLIEKYKLYELDK